MLNVVSFIIYNLSFNILVVSLPKFIMMKIKQLFAIGYCLFAINCFAQTAEEYCQLGAKKVDLKEYKEAIEDYTKAIELKPKLADGYNGRGLTLSRTENYKAAIQDFNKVIELSPKDVKAYHDRGTAKAKLGDNKGAVQDFTKVIDLNP